MCYDSCWLQAPLFISQLDLSVTLASEVVSSNQKIRLPVVWIRDLTSGVQLWCGSRQFSWRILLSSSFVFTIFLSSSSSSSSKRLTQTHCSEAAIIIIMFSHHYCCWKNEYDAFEGQPTNRFPSQQQESADKNRILTDRLPAVDQAKFELLEVSFQN